MPPPTQTLPEQAALRLRMAPAIEMTDDQFFAFCQLNRDLRIERTSDGEVIIMPPTGGVTGNRNADLTAALVTWARQEQSGVAFDSSTGFTLPGGSTRSPDASWVKKSRLAKLSSDEKQKFLPLCPDFVIELRSPSDTPGALQEKMQEYLDNGLRLGWLIDPSERCVFIYRPGHPGERLDHPDRLSDDSVLPGFELEFDSIWKPDL